LSRDEDKQLLGAGANVGVGGLGGANIGFGTGRKLGSEDEAGKQLVGAGAGVNAGGLGGANIGLGAGRKLEG